MSTFFETKKSFYGALQILISKLELGFPRFKRMTRFKDGNNTISI